MPRGGRREGAGRPRGTGKFGEPTKPIRVPLSLIPSIKLMVEAMIRADFVPPTPRPAKIKKIRKPPKPYVHPPEMAAVSKIRMSLEERAILNGRAAELGYSSVQDMLHRMASMIIDSGRSSA